MDVKVIPVDRKLTLWIALILLLLLFSAPSTHVIASCQYSRCSCFITCMLLNSRLVIKGNTPDQDLLVGVVSWGLG